MAGKLSKVNLIGDPFAVFVIHDFKMPAGRSITFLDGFPAWLQKRVNNWVSPRPVFIHNLCIGCKECEQCCPPKAIHMVNNRPYVDMNKCIKCFCCQELCPKKAVEIKRSGLVQKFLR